MPDFLSQMADLSRARADRARTALPESALRDQIATLAPPRRLLLDSFLLIAEIKRASPSSGPLHGSGLDIAQRAAEYASSGAGAISVLTEPSRFHGSLQDLQHASNTGAVTMRKDFLVDPYQILEARAHGASGVLLIVRVLSDSGLTDMLALASELGLFTLVECFDDEDLARCRALPRPGRSTAPILLGLNSRDLRDLRVRPERFEQLANSFPEGFPRIAESGLETPKDIRRIAELGYHGALVGSALMRSGSPGALCRAMLREGAAIPGAPP
jgi:indole-3-glycerol phosphate synthase